MVLSHRELQSVMTGNENDTLNLISDDDTRRLEIAQGNLIPVLVKAVQELSAANRALEARVAALESA